MPLNQKKALHTVHWFEWAEHHLRTIRVALAPGFILLVGGVYAFVYLTGGIKFVYSHSMYLPILLSGMVYGISGGVAIGLLGGIALGPLMPIDVLTGEQQHLANWLYRTGFFVLIGFLSGLASNRARAYIEHLKWISRHDPSTGLPNRRALSDRVAAIGAAKDRHDAASLVVISVENMMELKSALGFSIIATAISQLASRFSSYAADKDIYRTETAQLCVLLTAESQQTELLLDALVAASREPILYNDIPIHIDSRMGMVRFSPAAGAAPQTLLQQAEAALLVAQNKAQDCVVYAPEITQVTEETLIILGGLKEAVNKGQLSLDYQPKVILSSGAVYGAEALIRWNHPERGPLPPEAFIPRSEQSTLINVVTEFALTQAVDQMKRWRDIGILLPIAVNISTRNLLQPGFADLVANLLSEAGIGGEFLELEITEGALMTDMERTIEELARMTELNIIISIDDFGTGYSSLQYLHRLPISLIKVDQSFVRRLPEDKGALSIVEAAVTLAHKMEMKVIAEGVESTAVYRHLAAMGCDMAQGYRISRPLSATAFTDWYRTVDGRFTLPS